MTIRAEPIADSPTIARGQLDALIRFADADGVDTATILARYGLARQETGGGQGRLALLDYFRVERDIARAMDDLTAHLSSRKLTYRTGDFVVRQIGMATNLGEAMVTLCEYFNMMHGAEYNKVQEGRKTVTLSIDDHDFPYTMGDSPDFILFTGECVQIKVHCLLDSLSEGLAARALRRVGIVRQPETARGQTIGPEHLGFWPRTPLMGQACYALTYDLALSKQPMPPPGTMDLSSAGILGRVIDHLEQTTNAHRDVGIIERVVSLMADGHSDQDKIAALLDTSVATLRRRLTERGTSFRSLLADHRIRVAEAMLRRQVSLRLVTETLGYSDIRAFNRAFKRARGVTPFEFSRQSHAES